MRNILHGNVILYASKEKEKGGERRERGRQEELYNMCEKIFGPHCARDLFGLTCSLYLTENNEVVYSDTR